MKVGFNSPAGQVDEQPRKHHLRNSDHIPIDGSARVSQYHIDRKPSQKTPNRNRGYQMNMNTARRPSPGPW